MRVNLPARAARFAVSNRIPSWRPSAHPKYNRCMELRSTRGWLMERFGASSPADEAGPQDTLIQDLLGLSFEGFSIGRRADGTNRLRGLIADQVRQIRSRREHRATRPAGGREGGP